MIYHNVDTKNNKKILSKSSEQIKKIKKAQEITDDAFSYVLNKIKIGITEKQIAHEIETFIMSRGADKLAFDLIVVTGTRGALPHGKPSDNKVKRGDLLTIDMGTVVDGLHSDMTRTIAIGNINDEKLKAYNTVLCAQTSAISNVIHNVKARDIDNIARTIINNAGYGEAFVHSTGHGIGLEIHEPPFISAKSTDILSKDTVITIEPGIYLPDKFGIRIEDMVLITDNGCEILTHSPKELIILENT